MTLSEESGIGESQKAYLNNKNYISFSLVSASPEYRGKCRALRGDRGMFAYTGQNVMAKQKQLCRHS